MSGEQDSLDRLNEAIGRDDIEGIKSAADEIGSGCQDEIRCAFFVAVNDAKPDVCRSLFEMLNSETRAESKNRMLSWAMTSCDPVAMARLTEDLYGDAHEQWEKNLDDARACYSPGNVKPSHRATILYLASEYAKHHPDQAERVDEKVRGFEEWLDSA